MSQKQRTGTGPDCQRYFPIASKAPRAPTPSIPPRPSHPLHSLPAWHSSPRPRSGAAPIPGLLPAAPPSPSFPLPSLTHVPNGEEDERGGEQQRQHVAEGCEREGHGGGGGPGAARGLPGAIIHSRGRAAQPLGYSAPWWCPPALLRWRWAWSYEVGVSM